MRNSKIWFWALLHISVQAKAQSLQTYTGPFGVTDKGGKATYQFLEADGGRVLQGSFRYAHSKPERVLNPNLPPGTNSANEQGTFRQGLKHGPWTYRYEQALYQQRTRGYLLLTTAIVKDVRTASGSYVDGRLSGTWTFKRVQAFYGTTASAPVTLTRSLTASFRNGVPFGAFTATYGYAPTSRNPIEILKEWDVDPLRTDVDTETRQSTMTGQFDANGALDGLITLKIRFQDNQPYTILNRYRGGVVVEESIRNDATGQIDAAETPAKEVMESWTRDSLNSPFLVTIQPAKDLKSFKPHHWTEISTPSNWCSRGIGKPECEQVATLDMLSDAFSWAFSPIHSNVGATPYEDVFLGTRILFPSLVKATYRGTLEERRLEEERRKAAEAQAAARQAEEERQIAEEVRQDSANAEFNARSRQLTSAATQANRYLASAARAYTGSNSFDPDAMLTPKPWLYRIVARSIIPNLQLLEKQVYAKLEACGLGYGRSMRLLPTECLELLAAAEEVEQAKRLLADRLLELKTAGNDKDLKRELESATDWKEQYRSITGTAMK